MFPACILKKLAEFFRLRSVWNQNRNSAGRYRHKRNIFDINFKKSKREPAIIWKRINCQRITSKNTRPWWVDTWARDTVRWYWSADTLFWQLSIDDNIDVQSASSWAPKVARKCGMPVVRTDGWSVGRSVGHAITKFSGMGRLLSSAKTIPYRFNQQDPNRGGSLGCRLRVFKPGLYSNLYHYE